MSRPRTAKEMWQLLVDEAGDDEVERAANVSVEHAERELRAEGYDVAAERAKAKGIIETLGREQTSGVSPARGDATVTSAGAGAGGEPTAWTSEPPRSPARSRAPSKLLWLWAALAAAAVSGGVAYAVARWVIPDEPPVEVPQPPPERKATPPTGDKPGPKPGDKPFGGAEPGSKPTR